MDKGELVYTTPRSGRIRMAVSVLFSGFLCFGFGMALWLVLNHWQTYGTFLQWFAAGLFLFLLVFSPLIAPQTFLYNHFAIYANGVTSQAGHFFVFRREGRFVPYAQMKGFAFSPDGERCVIYLESGDYEYYWDRRKGPIRALRKALKKRSIRNVPWACSRCGDESFVQACDCGERRF